MHQTTPMKIDTLQALETPEGIDIEFQYAGPTARVLAYLIDGIIKSILTVIIAIPFSFFGALGFGLITIAYFLIEWFYPVFLEVLRNGQTFGKSTMNLQVISDDGTPINWSKSILRNLLRVVDFLPLGYLLGLISISCNSQFKRLGDLAAGTVVVYTREKASNMAATFSQENAPIKALPITLSLEEQRAILSFSERRQFFSQERQQELAEELRPLFPEDPDLVSTLYQTAAAIKGARL